MRIVCQKCGQNYDVKNSSDGEVVTCKCGQQIVLPEIQNGYQVIKQRKIVINTKKSMLQKIRDWGYQSEETANVIQSKNQDQLGKTTKLKVPDRKILDVEDFNCLRKCPACGKQVSNEAKSCPHCGHPLEEPFTSGGLCIFIGFILGVLGFAICLIGWGRNGAKYSFLGMVIHFVILYNFPNLWNSVAGILLN